MSHSEVEPKHRFFLHQRWKNLPRRQVANHGACMLFPPCAAEAHPRLVAPRDPLRCGTLALALLALEGERVADCRPEVGACRGETNRRSRAAAGRPAAT